MCCRLLMCFYLNSFSFPLLSTPDDNCRSGNLQQSCKPTSHSRAFTAHPMPRKQANQLINNSSCARPRPTAGPLSPPPNSLPAGPPDADPNTRPDLLVESGHPSGGRGSRKIKIGVGSPEDFSWIIRTMLARRAYSACTHSRHASVGSHREDFFFLFFFFSWVAYTMRI
jgi:hypothetical protein